MRISDDSRIVTLTRTEKVEEIEAEENKINQENENIIKEEAKEKLFEENNENNSEEETF